MIRKKTVLISDEQMERFQNIWLSAYIKACDMFLSSNRPEILDEDGEEVTTILEYALNFSVDTLDAYRNLFGIGK